MSIDLATLIDRLEKIEGRLIKEESAILNIRCEVRDTLTLAKTIWDMQASEAMNGCIVSPQRQSIVSLSGQALFNGMKWKSANSDKSKTHPAPKIDRSISIDEDDTKTKHLSSHTTGKQSHYERESNTYQNFMRFSRWDRFLRSDFFRKGMKSTTDGYYASQSELALNAIDERVSTRFVIHPESKFKRVWDSIESIIIILQFLILPLILGFTEFRDGLPVFSIITAIIYFMSMCISSRTGIVKNFVVLMDPGLIFDFYLKSYQFFFDLITIFPYVFVIDVACPFSSNELLNYGLRFICILNGLRILKLAYGPEPFWYKAFMREIRLKTKINATSVGIAKIFMIMAIYWHWSACIYSLVTKITEQYSGYKTYSLYSLSDRYILFFYQAAAETLAAGFGALPPSNSALRLLTILNFLISSYLVATLVGNISSFMIGRDSSGRIFQEKMDEVIQYIAYKGLDWNLRNRVLEYYQYKYSGGKYFDEKRIMTELNNPLRQAIQLNNCKSLILKVPFFRDADNSFISQVVLCLEVNHFLTGDLVIEAGSTGDEMYFISSGVCEVSIGGDIKATLASGSFFGEISLLFGKMKRTASIKCVTPCVLYSLSKKQLDEVLLHHPQMNSAIRAVAELRLREAGKIKEEEEQKVAEKENLILSVDQKIDIKHSTIEQAHEDGSNEEVESLI